MLKETERMKSKLLLTLLLTFTLVLAACAPAPTATEAPTSGIPVTGDTATPEVTTAPTEPPTTAATEAMTATEAPTQASTTQVSTIGTATAVTLKVDNSGAAPHLVDDQGRAVYLYTKDTQGTTTSACTDTECTSEWTPVLVT